MRRLVFLSAILAVLGGAAWFVSWKAQQSPISEPLAAASRQPAAKILIDQARESIVLEKKGDIWRITAPLEDLADSQGVEELVAGLRSFSLSSQVADNPSSHADYDLTESSATRLRFFTSANAAPALDGYFGKEALGYGSHYFRQTNETAVRLASGVSSYRLKAAADHWRERKLLASVDQKTLASIIIRTSLSRFELKKTSSAWISQSRIKPENIEPLVADLFNLRAADFVSAAEKTPAAGFEKPFLSFELEKTRLVVGAAKPEKDKQQPRYRYAQVDGRDGLFLVSVGDVGSLISRLK